MLAAYARGASDPVVLNSLTTRSTCRALKTERLGAKRPFTEHCVDKGPLADQRLIARLIETNIRSRVIGFPVVDVGSERLINGPSLAAILAKAPPRGKGFAGLWRAIARGVVQLS